MPRLLIDSSAWIEYFTGSIKGRSVRELVLREGAIVFTTGLVVSEVCTKFIREGLSPENAVDMLRSLSLLLPYDYSLGLETARLYASARKHRPKFGMADAHVLAAARLAKAQLITCDYDFSGMNGVTVIGK